VCSSDLFMSDQHFYAPKVAADVVNSEITEVKVKVKVNVKEDLSDKIVDCKFITDGCGASVACGSVITELVKGKTIEEALMLTPESILAVLGGLPEENIHCAALAVDTLKAAIANYSHPRNKLQNI